MAGIIPEIAPAMTVPSEQSRITYDTDGTSVSFPVPFRFLQNRDLRVTLIAADDSSRLLVLDVDYSVAGAGQQSGGTLSTVDILAAGATLLIERIVAITQETEYQRNDPFPERAHERALDKLTMICQQLAAAFGLSSLDQRRVLSVRDTESQGIGFLPLKSERASMVLGFDANGDPIAVPSDLPAIEGALQRAEQAATTATEGAADAAGSASAANASAVSAGADADRAENAATAAALSIGTYYPTITAGRAAVADGASFWVEPNSTDGLTRFTMYTRTSASTQTEKFQAVAAGEVDAIRTVTYLLYGPEDFDQTGLINASGVLVPSALWSATGFLEVLGGMSVAIAAACYGTARHAWYDANKNLISVINPQDSPNSSAAWRPKTNSFIAPEGARYIRMSAQNSWKQYSSFSSQEPGYSIRALISTVNQHIEQIAISPWVSSQINSIWNSLDESSDAAAAWFIPTWHYTRSWRVGSIVTPVAVVSRDSDRQFTVAAADIGAFAPQVAIVLRAGSDGYVSRVVNSVSGNSVIVDEDLPATFDSVQAMQEVGLGQHLSQYGYLGLADYIVEQLQRYSYRKTGPVFVYNPDLCTTPSFSDPNIYDLNGNRLATVDQIGGAAGGGYVAGTQNLVRECSTKSSTAGIESGTAQQLLGRFYSIQDTTSGAGIELPISVNGREGFVEIFAASARVNYLDTDEVAQITTGRARLEVIADGQTVHVQDIENGAHERILVDFPATQSLVVRAILLDSTPSAVRLNSVIVYGKSSATPADPIFQNGDRIAFLMDSWGEYPMRAAGEPNVYRADGSLSGGQCYVSERVRERLAEQGVTVETLNMARGGQTSAWALHWAQRVIDLNPTHVVLNFQINDTNSRGNVADRTPSAYDFDPENQWAGKSSASGGVFGSVTNDQWYANMAALVRKFAAAGIRPIVLMPGHTASETQAFVLRNLCLSRMLAGISN